MLAELRVENLLLIERAELVLDPGLNAITGETGAGKTVLAHALDLLLGGRPRPGIIRPGAKEAYVEGVFEPGRRLEEDPELGGTAERLPLAGDDVVLARRVTSEGRTRAYVGGRSATAADLRVIGSRLLAFYGQHEHRKLTLASAQLEILDAFCGREHLLLRAEFEREWSAARQVDRDLAELRERVAGRERQLDLLDWEIGEIDQAGLSEEEESELEAEQARLAAGDSLRSASLAAAEALEPQGDGGGGEGVLGVLAGAGSELDGAAGADERLGALSERFATALLELEELGRELRDYEASLEAEPGRLVQVNERLELFARLKRKYGGTTGAVVEHAARSRDERDRLAGAGEATTRLASELEQRLARLDELAGRLSDARHASAPRLEEAVARELECLAMEDASFEILLAERSRAGDGPLERFGPRGADAAEFRIAPNPGVPSGPLREIASGGELSRVMLALLSASAPTRGADTVVFDEIDAGVGGNTARAVGERLRDLSDGRQVLCITHLPQIASLAARHFRVTKSSAGGSVARTDVERLERGELVVELCRMLGADPAESSARRHAERLLQAA